MSVALPRMAAILGSITVAESDIIEAKVHLGATKEVSSWELLLRNWKPDQQYSPGEANAITLGADGHIDIGREGVTPPQIITCRVESLKFEGTHAEHYLRVGGRCWGEKLFRKVVTKTYSSQKGEAIVKDLMDSYAGISHNRGGTELVEDTDTTFTLLEYENTPVFDILKDIAAACDKSGVIGYDFRVAPDGKFEFFQRLSKSSSVSLSELIETSEYRKSITAVRNKITVYGAADKSVPLDKDAWTESLTPTDGAWSSVGGTVSLDTGFKIRGSGSIKETDASAYYGGAIFTLNSGKEVNANLYPVLSFWLYLGSTFNGNVTVYLLDTSGRQVYQTVTFGNSKWNNKQLKVGSDNAESWETIDSGFDWTNIQKFRVDCWFNGTGSDSFWVDGLYFGGRRYSAVQEDSGSQSSYGLREIVDTDEELYSDNECSFRAKALLNYLKNAAEYLTVKSTVIDYGTTPLLAGDKIHVVLPNENVDADYRILSVDYFLDAKKEELELSIELGHEVPLLADYIYALRSKTSHLGRYKIARVF